MTPFKQANKSYTFIHPDGRREHRTYCYQRSQPRKKQPVRHSETMRTIARLGLNAKEFRALNPHLSDDDLLARAKKIWRESITFSRSLAIPGAVRLPTDASVENCVIKSTLNRSNVRE